MSTPHEPGLPAGHARYGGLGPEIRDLFSLSGRVAVITGGGAGIGRAIGIGFGWFGADVVVIDKDQEAAERVAGEIRGTGRKAVAFSADVTDLGQLEALAARIAADFGRLDICVTSAGGGMRSSILTTRPEDWRRVVDLNLAGTWNSARAFGRLLVDGGGGKLILVASIHGHVGDPDQSAYAPAKAAVVGLGKVLALEWAKANVQVNCIAPSHVKTQRVQSILDDPDEYARIRARSPIGRFGEVWELIGPAVFLASDASSLVTGHSLIVDGGWTAT